MFSTLTNVVAYLTLTDKHASKLIVTCSLENSELSNLNCRRFVVIGNISTTFGENVFNYVGNDC